MAGLEGGGDGEADFLEGSASLVGTENDGGGHGGDGDGGGDSSTSIAGRWRTSKSFTLVV